MKRLSVMEKFSSKGIPGHRWVAAILCSLLILTAGNGLAIEEVRRGIPGWGPRTVEHFGLHKDNDNGLRYIAEGKFEKAVRLYQKALGDFDKKLVKDDAFHVELLLNYSTALYEAGKDNYFNYKNDTYFQKALTALEECLQLQPHNWRAMEVRGKIDVKMSKWKEAQADYEQAMRNLTKDDEEYADAAVRLEKQLKKIEHLLQLKENKADEK